MPNGSEQAGSIPNIYFFEWNVEFFALVLISFPLHTARELIGFPKLENFGNQVFQTKIRIVVGFVISMSSWIRYFSQKKVSGSIALDQPNDRYSKLDLFWKDVTSAFYYKWNTAGLMSLSHSDQSKGSISLKLRRLMDSLAHYTLKIFIVPSIAACSGMERYRMFWHDKLHFRRLLWGFVLLFQNCLILEAKARIGHPVHTMHLIFYPCWQSWLINNGHTEISFLPCGHVERQERCVRHNDTFIHDLNSGFTVKVEPFAALTSDASGLFQEMESLQKTWKVLLGLFNWHRLSGSSNRSIRGINCIFLFCCIISLWYIGGKRLPRTLFCTACMGFE